MVVKGEIDDYADHPTPADVLLVVEIADSSLTYDRNDKAALYAGAGVPEYWVLSIKARTLEALREPMPMEGTPFGYDYKVRIVYTENETVTPQAAPQSVVRVADLLPKEKA